MCDNNNIYMCPPVNVLYHIVYLHRHLTVEFIDILVLKNSIFCDIFHSALFNALSTTIALPNMTNDKELPEYYDLKVCWHVIL